MNLIEILIEKSSKKYREFSRKLVFTKYEILGVKLPIIRDIAKNLSENEKLRVLKNDLNFSTFEEYLIYGFILGYSKIPYEEFLLYFYKFIPYVDNWSLCDSTIASMKIIAKNCEKFSFELDKLFNSKNEFYLRIAFVILLDYFIDDKWLDYIFYKCDNVNFDAYYVKMAKAWLLSVCFIKYKEKTLKYLINSKLDDFTFNKTISKICDSYRVTAIDKECVKTLKRKKF